MGGYSDEELQQNYTDVASNKSQFISSSPARQISEAGHSHWEDDSRIFNDATLVEEVETMEVDPPTQQKETRYTLFSQWLPVRTPKGSIGASSDPLEKGQLALKFSLNAIVI